METLRCDVLVVGGSLAGLRVAIAAAEAGADVVLLSRGVAGRSGSAAVASNDLCGYIPDPELDDSAAQFAADTVRTGREINDPLLVAALVEDAGDRILELQRFGIELLSVGGRPDRLRSPGHSRPRSFRVLPIPGKPIGVALTLPLRAAAERLGVRCLDRFPVLELTRQGDAMTGALAVDLAAGAPVEVVARAVVLATGGGSYLYERTNATSDVLGEGYALALQAGAQVRDMEFVQFHPTRMDAPLSRMVTEGLIDDGAVLRNNRGEEFMYRYHPEGSMAPRDLRCRGIFEEVQRGAGVDGYVLLDCSTIAPERLALRHQALVSSLRNAGLDFPTEPIKVSPAAHHFMGGIAIDPQGATGVPGLYAAGEVTGGVHGANRVGSAAYSEALVIGRRAGMAAAAHAQAVPPPAGHRRLHMAPPSATAVGGAHAQYGGGPGGTVHWRELWRGLRATMWQQVSLMRSAQGLQQALTTVGELRAALPSAADSWATAAQQASLALGLTTAEAVIRGALLREESRGAHWRSDFPQPSERWLGNSFLRLQDGRWQQEYRPLSG